jgi:hypothetical protein
MSRRCALLPQAAIAKYGNEAACNGIQASETGATRKRLPSNPVTGGNGGQPSETVS